MAHILIVEDDDNSAEMLAALVSDAGHTASIATDLQQARQQLDLHLPDGSGLDLFADERLRGDADIVLITGQASVETSVQALRLGAADYLVKPVNLKQLRRVLDRLTGSPRPQRAPSPSAEPGRDRPAADDSDANGYGLLRGRSAPMRRVYAQIRRVAPTAVNVLVVGESGTGKEVVAETIHQQSRRRNGPFLAINCGAISSQLIESELFGHEKGSFTGAVRQHQGFFERADGGTLFLDEITEMPLDLQVKLLRVLETGRFARVGSDTLLETDVRIIAATNRVPAEAVTEQKLREDLYYRLNVFQIQLPPLRDRLEDIDLLAPLFLEQLNAREKVEREFAPEALVQLRRHHWPGNVRELRNIIQRAAIMADGKRITAVELPGATPTGIESVPPDTVEAEPIAPATAPSAPALADRAGMVCVPIGTSLAEMERRLIEATLEACDGVREKTAATLGISAKTLYNRLRQYEQDGLEVRAVTPGD
jgi:DNA-binding NtrC family response regulator